MNSPHVSILTDIESYYNNRLREHGACARGVDWNGEPSQQLRFEQLLKILDDGQSHADKSISLNDFGCGYGALLEHACANGLTLDYHGFDLSGDMIAAALQKKPIGMNATFVVSDRCSRVADYSVASGLFNVRQETATASWEAFIKDVLHDLDACSQRGFSFNCLTSYSDADKMRSHLYYADPCFYFDYCKRHFSKNVALLHDYGLYEFTVLVRKPAPSGA